MSVIVIVRFHITDVGLDEGPLWKIPTYILDSCWSWPYVPVKDSKVSGILMDNSILVHADLLRVGILCIYPTFQLLYWYQVGSTRLIGHFECMNTILW